MPILYYNMPNHNILGMQSICVRSDGFQYFKINSFKCRIYTCITSDYHINLRLFCACVSKIQQNLICWWSISMYIACKDYPVPCEPWKRPTTTLSRQMWTHQCINSFRTVRWWGTESKAFKSPIKYMASRLRQLSRASVHLSKTASSCVTQERPLMKSCWCCVRRWFSTKWCMMWSRMID